MPHQGFYEINRWSANILDLPVMAMPGNMWHITRHWQDGIEVLLPLRGSLTVAFSDRSYRIDSGGLIAIDAGLSHECFSSSEDSLQLIFNIETAQLRRPTPSQVWFATSGPHGIPQDHPDVIAMRHTVFQLARICGKYWSDDNGILPGAKPDNEEWYQARKLFHQSLQILSRHLTEDFVIPEQRIPHSFQQCLQAIHENYTFPLDAKQLAQKLGYGESTIYRLFRTYTGISFNSYLTGVRLNAACGRLRLDRDNVLEVAMDSGFQSISSFYRLFKTYYGISPLEYRKRISSNTRNPFEQDEMRRFNLWRSFEQSGCTWDELAQLCKQPKA